MVHGQRGLADLAHGAACQLDRGGYRRAIAAKMPGLHRRLRIMAGIAGQGLGAGGVKAGDAARHAKRDAGAGGCGHAAASAPVSAAMVALARACSSCMRMKWPMAAAVAAATSMGTAGTQPGHGPRDVDDAAQPVLAVPAPVLVLTEMRIVAVVHGPVLAIGPFSAGRQARIRPRFRP